MESTKLPKPQCCKLASFELWILIAKELDNNRDINALCRVNHSFYRLLNEHLWHLGARYGYNGGYPMTWAMGANRVSTAEKALEYGVDVNATDSDGQSLLMQTARWKHWQLAQLFLDRGADISFSDEQGRTALHVAAASTSTSSEMVRLLLRNGANPSAQDNEGQTPLHTCWGDVVLYRARVPGVAEILLEHGADISLQTTTGLTPLHVVSTKSLPDCVQMLLYRGADIEARSHQLATPLHFASKHGDTGAARILLRNGASVNAKDKQGHSPLWMAAKHGYAVMATLLLDHGADYTSQASSDEDTPLHAAVTSGALAIVRELLDRGANCSMLSDSHKRHMFLHAVSELGDPDVMQVFIDYGADVHEVFADGSTILHSAAQSEACQDSQGKVVDVLIKNGAAVDVENHSGYTPFCFGYREGTLLRQHDIDETWSKSLSTI